MGPGFRRGIHFQMEKFFYVYILTNKPNGTLYIGMTGDLSRRMFEHKNKLIDGFTKQHGLHMLVYYEAYPTPQEASLRERQMKEWQRQWKIELIEKNNKEWRDLSDGLL